MIVISKQWSFDSSHSLWNDFWTPSRNKEVFGKCARLHGHTYNLEVAVTGEVTGSTGMIMNYFDLDGMVKPIVEELDHRHLPDIFKKLTTAENMVEEIGRRVHTELVKRHDDIFIYQVTLQETPKTKAVWRP